MQVKDQSITYYPKIGKYKEWFFEIANRDTSIFSRALEKKPVHPIEKLLKEYMFNIVINGTNDVCYRISFFIIIYEILVFDYRL